MRKVCVRACVCVWGGEGGLNLTQTRKKVSGVYLLPNAGEKKSSFLARAVTLSWLLPLPYHSVSAFIILFKMCHSLPTSNINTKLPKWSSHSANCTAKSRTSLRHILCSDVILPLFALTCHLQETSGTILQQTSWGHQNGFFRPGSISWANIQGKGAALSPVFKAESDLNRGVCHKAHALYVTEENLPRCTQRLHVLISLVFLSFT